MWTHLKCYHSYQYQVLRIDGHYGKTDNLHIYLDGNRMTGVLEDAEAVTTPGSMDFAGKTDKVSEYGYDSAGRLVRDDIREIKSVEYDNLGHPVRINFADGNYTRHVYSASGSRLKTVNSTAVLSLASADDEALLDLAIADAENGSETYVTDDTEEDADTDGVSTGADSIEPGFTGTDTMEYRGNAVWRNGKVEMVLFPGGYATLANGSESGVPTFHYYTTDYLGNVRAVTNGTTGETEQTMAYYPFGSVLATLGMNRSLQPYKFGGKELLTGNGLNEYDFGARSYVPSVPAFTSPDPLSEKYYWLSPYLYCANNPINIMDPSGMELIFTGGTDDDYQYICTLLNNITHNQYSFSYDSSADGNSAKISLSHNENFDSSVLSAGNNIVNNLLSSIVTDERCMTTAIDNSSDVLIGDVMAKAVDLDDVRNIGSHEAITSESVFLHEVIEQSELQFKGKEYNALNVNKAHNTATQQEANYLGISISPVRLISDSDSNGIKTMPVSYSLKMGTKQYDKTIIVNFLKNNVIP